MAINMTQIQVTSNTRLDPNLVMQGIRYALEKLSREKPLQDVVSVTSITFLFCSFFFSILLLFLFMLFFDHLAKHICPRAYLEAWLKSTQSAREAIRRILLVKLILLVPFFSLLLTSVLVVLTLYSSSRLVSPSVKEFRVAGACPEELCINENTNSFFREGDLCKPEHFK